MQFINLWYNKGVARVAPEKRFPNRLLLFFWEITLGGNLMKKKTNAEFLSEVYELVGNDYVFNEEYLTAVKKVSVTHKTCGNTYEVAPNTFFDR